jgi:hypothetical protein
LIEEAKQKISTESPSEDGIWLDITKMKDLILKFPNQDLGSEKLQIALSDAS